MVVPTSAKQDLLPPSGSVVVSARLLLHPPRLKGVAHIWWCNDSARKNPKYLYT